MNYPAASSGVSSGNFYRPKGWGIEPSSAGGGLKTGDIHKRCHFTELMRDYLKRDSGIWASMVLRSIWIPNPFTAL